ncbi:hypothetical protein MXB_4693 [Myxobolus squamalis]|nr:hypothetical protein MXB_4693 [Myxobolus squamalis]
MLELLAAGNVKLQKQKITLSSTDSKTVQTFIYTYCGEYELPDCVFLKHELQKSHAKFDTGGNFKVKNGEMKIQLLSPDGSELYSKVYEFMVLYDKFRHAIRID